MLFDWLEECRVFFIFYIFLHLTPSKDKAFKKWRIIYAVIYAVLKMLILSFICKNTFQYLRVP